MTDEVDAILNDYFDYPQEVTLSASGTPLENIKQIAYDAVNFNTKVNLLKHLLQENEDMSRVLIFVNNKKISDMLHGRIDEDFEDQFVIHSNKSQNYRLSTMASFQEGNLEDLLDIMMGLDISNITHVINFEMPAMPCTVSGRTGRADKQEQLVYCREESGGTGLDCSTEVEVSKVIEPEKSDKSLSF
jgi:ATP-dependent RNA helicase RhlE